MVQAAFEAGRVIPSMYAALVEVIQARKSVTELCMKCMKVESTWILKPQHRVRYRQDRRLLQS